MGNDILKQAALIMERE